MLETSGYLGTVGLVERRVGGVQRPQRRLETLGRGRQPRKADDRHGDRRGDRAGREARWQLAQLASLLATPRNQQRVDAVGDDLMRGMPAAWSRSLIGRNSSADGVVWMNPSGPASSS
jgi:hypothetical protein